jgi:hypothetical protein
MNAVQYVSLGKLPIGLVNPSVLHKILKNVSLQLLGGFQLIAGTRIENIHLYYELISVAIVGNAHSVKVLMAVPLVVYGPLHPNLDFGPCS